MDKVVLSNADIEEVLRWRDGNLDLVRKNPMPLRAVEIVCMESGYVIKGVRDGNSLKLYLRHNGTSMGLAKFDETFGGMWRMTVNRMQVERESIQSVLTVYCSTMAIMANAPSAPGTETDPATRTRKPGKKSKKRATANTYIIKRTRDSICVVPEGHHASPQGEFTVRGHFRHYKSGKVVWIAEYIKGAGGKREKTYKLKARQRIKSETKECVK